MEQGKIINQKWIQDQDANEKNLETESKKDPRFFHSIDMDNNFFVGWVLVAGGVYSVWNEVKVQNVRTHTVFCSYTIRMITYRKRNQCPRPCVYVWLSDAKNEKTNE